MNIAVKLAKASVHLSKRQRGFGMEFKMCVKEGLSALKGGREVGRKSSQRKARRQNGYLRRIYK